MKQIRIVSMILAIVMLAAVLVACKPAEDDNKVVYEDYDPADVVKHGSFESVYNKIGSKVTIDMVEEDKDTGLAYVTVDGVKYELGMDFLSMAMVYNLESTKYASNDDVYNEWWKLYIQRWNYLMPEIPLYSNQYFDLYNAKIQNFVTTPYWGPADAIIAASVKAGESNSVILGSNTDLSGAFRDSDWGKSSPGASDLDIENLTSGHATVMTNSAGAYIWNMYALAEEPVATKNADGTLTYTIKIKNDLKFSDGSAITAKNYVASVLACSTAVAKAAGGSGQSGLNYVGFKAFNAYEGNGDRVYFEGIKLLGDYEFSVTVLEDYADYYYAMAYAGFSPVPLQLFLGSKGDIVVDEATKACGLNADFYAQDSSKAFTVAAEIKANLKWDSGLPYSGPYTVAGYDASANTATLKINPNYTGDTARGKASIETITYVKTVSETQMDWFLTGKVDVLAGITGADDTKAALKTVNENPEKYAETHYDRAGYGKIGFRADFGPTGFKEVRQAIAYTINRPQFAQTFTGGYGSVVHGPYYTGFSAYKAVEKSIKLNQYTYSVDGAIAALEAGGWVYNEKGETFDASKDTIRYKKLSGYEKSENNLKFATTDSKYKTVKINGEYYMPLAINFYGTQPNTVTDQLLTAWVNSENATKKIGMYIVYTETDFNTGLFCEYQQSTADGWDGVAKLNAINFATNFTSAAYDYSWNWTIDPDMYPNYSAYYVMDEADFLENYSK